MPVETRRANQKWMTNEILDMMEERRLLNIVKVYIDRNTDADILREFHKAR